MELSERVGEEAGKKKVEVKRGFACLGVVSFLYCIAPGFGKGKQLSLLYVERL